MLTWKLCALSGVQFDGGLLNDRLPGGKVNVAMGERQTASVSLSLEDPAAALVYPLYTVLKVLQDDTPVFTGLCLKPRFNIQAKAVQINAVDLSWRWEHLFVGQRSDGAGLPNAVSWNPWRWEARQPSSMLDWLAQHFEPTSAEAAAGVPTHGVYVEDQGIGTSRNRDVPPGTQGKKFLDDLSEGDSSMGIEYWFAPLDNTNYYHNHLQIFAPRMGSDKSGVVIFHAGWGQHNTTDFSWEPDGGPVVNRSTVTGQVIEGDPQKAARADQPEAQRGFGIYGDFQARADVLDQSVLNEYAQGQVSTAGWPQDFFSFIPAQMDRTGYVRNYLTGQWERQERQYGVPPSFGPDKDFWLGDTIRCIAKHGAIQENLTGRVTDGTITELDDGATVYEIACTPTISEVGVTNTPVTYS